METPLEEEVEVVVPLLEELLPEDELDVELNGVEKLEVLSLGFESGSLLVTVVVNGTGDIDDAGALNTTGTLIV